MGKTSQASVYRAFINKMKKKTRRKWWLVGMDINK
jgi:hypothetical protein